ncbi:hypothetical protein HDU85_006865 [Gaertneriomyces sp. JEL0708]|nr:hypothetical protein HDU85_006865 [Gaertneriomyces sp. JEL0708]
MVVTDISETHVLSGEREVHIQRVRHIQCQELSDYIDNRESTLKRLGVDKYAVIKVIYSDNCTIECNQLKAIHHQCYSTLIPLLKIEYPHIWQKVQRSRPKKNNPNGSFLSQVVQTIENQILIETYHFLISKDFSPEVLISDGLQVRREKNRCLTQQDLIDCSQHILERTGYDIKLALKSMEVPDEYYSKHHFRKDHEEERFFEIFDPNLMELDETGEGPVFRECLFPENPALDAVAKTAVAECTDTGYAALAFELWKDEYYYSGKSWWYFEDHHWKESKSGSHLQHRIQTNLFNIVDEATNWKVDDDEALHHCLKIMKRCLSTFSKARAVFNTCIGFFETKNFKHFQSNLNKNLKTLCFTNGVFDLDSGTLRDGEPDDFISIQLPYDYFKYTESDDEIKDQLEDIILKIIPQRDVLNYFFSELALSLSGRPHDRINIIQGKGAQGKSFLMGLMEACMAGLATTWSANILSDDFDICKPNPELADAKDKRFINIQEVKEGQKLNLVMLKKVTGRDNIRARALFENGGMFTVVASLFLSVNDLPEIQNDMHATWRRLRLIELKSLFVEEDDLVNEKEHIYKADTTLRHRIPEFAPYLMSLLVEVYVQKRFCEPPPSVLESTAKFRMDSDIYQQFFEDTCVLDNSNKGHVHVTTLWEKCQRWGGKTKNVNRKAMVEWFKKLDGVVYKNSVRIAFDSSSGTKEKVLAGFEGVRLNTYQTVASKVDFD